MMSSVKNITESRNQLPRSSKNRALTQLSKEDGDLSEEEIECELEKENGASKIKLK